MSYFLSVGTGLTPKRGADDPSELPNPENVIFLMGSPSFEGYLGPNRPLLYPFSTVLDSVIKEGILSPALPFCSGFFEFMNIDFVMSMF